MKRLLILLLAAALAPAGLLATPVVNTKTGIVETAPQSFFNGMREVCPPHDTVPSAASPRPVEYEDGRCGEADLTLGLYSKPAALFTLPRDPLFAYQWWLNNTGYVPGVPPGLLKKGADARVVGAWRLLGNFGSSKIKIAVIDAGFDTTNPDFTGVASVFNARTGESFLPSGRFAGDHGTPCAGLAAAPVNGVGLVGAAPNSELHLIDGISFRDDVIERALNYCLENDIDVLSISWGSPDRRPSERQLRAFRKLIEHGTVVVIAAGNEGSKTTMNQYARIPGVIAVGASTSMDSHAHYSNCDELLTLVAPSDGVLSVISTRARWDAGEKNWPNPFYADGNDHGPYLKSFGGTSAATPLVAGICALILSANPNLSPAEVKSILKRTADKIGHPSEYDKSGFSTKYGFGRVNAEKGVAEALQMRKQSRSVPKARQPASFPASVLPLAPATAPKARPSTVSGALFNFSATQVDASGYGLQVSVFYEFANMLKEVDRLEREYGFPVLVHIANVKERIAFRMLIGPFTDRAEAEAAQRQITLPNGKAPWLRELNNIE